MTANFIKLMSDTKPQICQCESTKQNKCQKYHTQAYNFQNTENQDKETRGKNIHYVQRNKCKNYIRLLPRNDAKKREWSEIQC